MKLYYFQVAPNPTRVRLHLAEKAQAGTAIPIEQVEVSLPRGEQRSPAHLARNPRGTLPVLELDDGSYVTESQTIVELIEELYPEPPMLGTDPVARARQRELERLADLRVLLPVAYIVHGSRSPLGWPPNPALVELGETLLPAGLQALERALGDGRPYLGGSSPSVVDCTLAAGLQFGRFGKLDPLEAFPALRAWDERYRQRPAARAVLVL